MNKQQTKFQFLVITLKLKQDDKLHFHRSQNPPDHPILGTKSLQLNPPLDKRELGGG